jgi:hypothetical protein
MDISNLLLLIQTEEDRELAEQALAEHAKDHETHVSTFTRTLWAEEEGVVMQEKSSLWSSVAVSSETVSGFHDLTSANRAS